MGWDVFLSHASDDKVAVAVPLMHALQRVGLSVWIDDQQIGPGESIRASIDSGLRHSRFGVVLLSPRYFSRRWTQNELDALMGLERDGRNVLIPVWIDMTHESVATHSPLMAARKAVRWSDGLDAVVSFIVAGTQDKNGEAIQDTPIAISPAEGKHDANEQIVMLARNKEGPAFISCPRAVSGALIEFTLDPGDEKGSAWLRALQSDGDPVVGYAIDLDAGLAAIEAVELEMTAGKSLWNVRLKRERRTYGADVLEPGFNALSTADLARLRARRILLDEPLDEASRSVGNVEFKDTLELFIRGLSSPVKTLGSPFPAFYRDLSHKPDWLLAACRLFGTYLLRVTGTVERVSRLDLKIEGEALQVDFEGVRARVFENEEPARIAVSGTCKLSG